MILFRAVLPCPLGAETVTFPAVYTGRDIKRVREGLGLTQIEFAGLMGVQPPTIRKWELSSNADMLIRSKYFPLLEEQENSIHKALLVQNEKSVGSDGVPLFTKMRNGFAAAGSELIIQALELFYGATDTKTPKGARALAMAALAYFIMPLDAIPDMIPLLGFTDDLAMIFGAINKLHPHINQQHKKQAREKFDDMFA